MRPRDGRRNGARRQTFPTWIGRTEEAEDSVTAAAARALAATLDMDAAARAAAGHRSRAARCRRSGTGSPSCPTRRCRRIGTDGHPRRGGFLPPVPLERRMWAGGAAQLSRDSAIGETLTPALRDHRRIAKRPARPGAWCSSPSRIGSSTGARPRGDRDAGHRLSCAMPERFTPPPPVAAPAERRLGGAGRRWTRRGCSASPPSPSTRHRIHYDLRLCDRGREIPRPRGARPAAGDPPDGGGPAAPRRRLARGLCLPRRPAAVPPRRAAADRRRRAGRHAGALHRERRGPTSACGPRSLGPRSQGPMSRGPPPAVPASLTMMGTRGKRMAGVLQGLRVIESSAFVAVPLAGMTPRTDGRRRDPLRPAAAAGSTRARWPVTATRREPVLGRAEQGQALDRRRSRRPARPGDRRRADRRARPRRGLLPHQPAAPAAAWTTRRCAPGATI